MRCSCDQKAPPLEIHPVESPDGAWTLFIPIYFHWVKKSKVDLECRALAHKAKRILYPHCDHGVGYKFTHTRPKHERENQRPLKHISLMPSSYIFHLKESAEFLTLCKIFSIYLALHSNARVCLRREMCYMGHYVTPDIIELWQMASGMYRATQRGRNPRRAQVFIYEMMKNDNFHPTITT